MKKRNRSASHKSFSPLIILTLCLAIVLPLIVWGVTQAYPIFFAPQAAEESTLRVWIDPQHMVVSPGQKVSLTVRAAFDHNVNILSSVIVPITFDSALNQPVTILSYVQPFRGKIEVGTFSVVAPIQKGQYHVDVLKNQLKLGGSQPANISVEGTTILVK